MTYIGMEACLQNISLCKQISENHTTPSTLLIPIHLLDYYNFRCKDLGKDGRRLYFQHLIRVYGKHLAHFGLSPHSSKWKKKYQDEGLYLKKLNFVPFPEDWEQIRHLGFAYGLAICKFFVVLLELEYSRYIKAGLPSDFMEIPPEKLQKSENNAGQAKNSYNKLNSITISEYLNQFSTTIGTLLIRDIDISKKILHRITCIRKN